MDLNTLTFPAEPEALMHVEFRKGEQSSKLYQVASVSCQFAIGHGLVSAIKGVPVSFSLHEFGTRHGRCSRVCNLLRWGVSINSSGAGSIPCRLEPQADLSILVTYTQSTTQEVFINITYGTSTLPDSPYIVPTADIPLASITLTGVLSLHDECVALEHWLRRPLQQPVFFRSCTLPTFLRALQSVPEPLRDILSQCVSHIIRNHCNRDIFVSPDALSLLWRTLCPQNSLITVFVAQALLRLPLPALQDAVSDHSDFVAAYLHRAATLGAHISQRAVCLMERIARLPDLPAGVVGALGASSQAMLVPRHTRLSEYVWQVMLLLLERHAAVLLETFPPNVLVQLCLNDMSVGRSRAFLPPALLFLHRLHVALPPESFKASGLVAALLPHARLLADVLPQLSSPTVWEMSPCAAEDGAVLRSDEEELVATLSLLLTCASSDFPESSQALIAVLQTHTLLQSCSARVQVLAALLAHLLMPSRVKEQLRSESVIMELVLEDQPFVAMAEHYPPPTSKPFVLFYDPPPPHYLATVEDLASAFINNKFPEAIRGRIALVLWRALSCERLGLCYKLRQHTQLLKCVLDMFAAGKLPFVFPTCSLGLLNVDKGNPLGSGVMGFVCRGSYQGETVAVKIFNVESIAFAWPDFLRELAVMSLLRSPYTCRSLAASVDGEEPFIVMPLYRRGSLSSLLEDQTSSRDIASLLRLFRSAAFGCQHLHNLGLIHRDIKPENFLLDENSHVVVTDMGCTRVRSEEMRHTACVGTPIFMAPEVYNGDMYDEKADVWSFGILLWQMTRGALPGSEQDDIEYINQLYFDPEYRLEYPESTCPLKGLIDSCIRTAPAQRPSFSQVIDSLEWAMRHQGCTPSPPRNPLQPLALSVDEATGSFCSDAGGVAAGACVRTRSTIPMQMLSALAVPSSARPRSLRGGQLAVSVVGMSTKPALHSPPRDRLRTFQALNRSFYGLAELEHPRSEDPYSDDPHSVHQPLPERYPSISVHDADKVTRSTSMPPAMAAGPTSDIYGT